MFGIGFWEIILILIISIIILNPNDYYKIFYNIGKIMKNIKTQKEKINNEISSFIKEKELEKDK